MKKFKLLIICLFISTFLFSCKSSTQDKEETNYNENEFQPYITEITYSNLSDNKTKSLLSDSLAFAGINPSNIKITLDNISTYNETIQNISLVKSDFLTTSNLNPEYDFENIDNRWTSSFPNFIGNNCRITTYELMKSFIEINKPDKSTYPILSMDKMAIDSKPSFNDKDIDKFNTFYASIPAKMTKDISTHVSEVKNYWEEKEVSFNRSKNISVITVWFHDDLDNILFVGHAGVLVKDFEKGSLLFFEKISFQEPYQLLKFNNKTELNDYLMNKYDISYNQPTAKPFIMENNDLLEGYRPNPNNKGSIKNS